MAESSYPVLPDERLAAGVARLAVRHQGRYSVETVQRLIADSYEQLAANAHVRTHLVVLAERFAAERPDALVHPENPIATGGRPRDPRRHRHPYHHPAGHPVRHLKLPVPAPCSIPA
ncbi:hypothetical protein OG357_36920 [Streptomyces sp. NBC_01255]|uniref:three-helix bundle dimerization domain-containing protein n=1 Tax=Streptomyces sp. NBC_01255 TaxID=2903798 RepID=UPI002E32D48A|nr:hypothetical protein [Streptomyces sp. NBC_01255]